MKRAKLYILIVQLLFAAATIQAAPDQPANPFPLGTRYGYWPEHRGGTLVYVHGRARRYVRACDCYLFKTASGRWAKVDRNLVYWERKPKS